MRMRRQSPMFTMSVDRAHRAEVDAVRDGAEDDGERESAPGDERGEVTRIVHWRIWARRIIACNPH